MEIQATFDLNVPVASRNPELSIEKEDFSLIADINSFVTVIYTDNNFERTHYLKIPQHKEPLHGVFREVQMNLSLTNATKEEWVGINVICFFVRARNNLTYLGHSGYLGLAPLPAAL